MMRTNRTLKLPTMRPRAGLLAPVLLSALLWNGVAARAAESEKKAAPMAWADVKGRKYDLNDVSKSKATVFLFVSTQCPVANAYTPRFLALAKDYQPRGVRFFLVDSNTEDSPGKFKQYVKERGFPFPAVKDNGTELADRLEAQATPQAVILDSTGTIRYLGRIDDNQDRAKVVRQDVREALNALLEGKPVARARTLTFGCSIFRDKPAPKSGPITAAVTYTRDIAPILNANCVACHREGDVAPFALENYRQARTWATAIKDYTARRIMPPWKPVAGHGEFHDTRGLTDTQIATLAAWTKAGAPEGNAKDLPPAPKFPDPDKWTLGTPDLVLQPARPYHLAEEGRDVYRNFVLPADFTEDRLVRAMEFKPGNRAIVHHIVTYIDPTGKSAQLDNKETEPGYTVPGTGIGVENVEWGDVWVPGNMARPLPPGVVTRIPKGAKLVMQVHYHKTGKPEVDTSQMALYFAKEKPEKQMITFPIGNLFFKLKPGESHQEVRASLTLPFDIHLHSIFPHMHMLGKEMQVTATLPDGAKKSLIWINDWDFNWQATYFYKEAVALPKGTKLDMVSYYDNSETNPRQTAHPPKTVRFGEQTTDEMCFVFLGLTVDQDKTANVYDLFRQAPRGRGEVGAP